MSKITSKNLSYDSTLPPFLQRLQNAHSNPQLDGRHEHAIARPKRARNVDEEDDDAPTYIDEATNQTLSREEYVALVGSGDGGAEADAKGAVAAAQEESGPKADVDGDDGGEGKTGKSIVQERVARIGAAKKRKTGKLVGAAEEGPNESGPLQSLRAEVTKSTQETTSDMSKSSTTSATVPAAAPTPAKSKKKTAKKVKLSFGDDADEG